MSNEAPQLHSIDPIDLAKFSLDQRNNLYWDGQIVHTSTSLYLTPKQSILATIVGIAAIGASLGTVANATASWLAYLSKANKTAAVTIVQSQPCKTEGSVGADQTRGNGR